MFKHLAKKKPTISPLHYEIARNCHEVNRSYCRLNGDDSQVAFEDASDDIKQNSIDGVEYISQHPEATNATLHDNWMRDKAADGWVYGPEKDPVKKTHPCMVPFDQMSIVDQNKDDLFYRIVRAFLAQ